MVTFVAKPDWIDTVHNGEYQCESCSYRSNKEKHLEQHCNSYHPEEPSYVLYFSCDQSISGREKLNERIDAKWMDLTGGQACFYDGDLGIFGDQLTKASRETGVKLYCAYRMYDPGLGLEFPQWWIDEGMRIGVFKEYHFPEDVVADPVNYDSD